MVFIKSVKLSNFKGYHHLREIGPFVNTNAIIGPNGTGKSNILDAITFALGDTSKNLRVFKMGDLVYTSATNEKEDHCYVIVELKFPGDTATSKFQRNLRMNGTETFFINDEQKTKEEYIKTLESHGIFAKHDNFVIRQGLLAKMTKDGDVNRGKFIDTVSGSAALEAECKELQKIHDKHAKELRTHQEVSQRNTTELRRLSIAHDVQKGIEEEMRKLADIKLDYYLLQIFPIEKGLEAIETDFEKRRSKLEKDLTAAGREEVSEDAKQEALREVSTRMKQGKKEVDISKNEYDKAERVLNECNEQVAHLEKKVEASKKIVKGIEKNVEARQKDREELQRKIAEKSDEIQKLEDDFQQRSQRILDENGLAEFYNLQKVVEENKASEELDKKKRNLEALELELQACIAILDMEKERLKLKQREVALLETNNPDEAKQKDLEARINSISEDIQKTRKNEADRDKYTAEYQDIQEKLINFGINKTANYRTEIRNKLKDHFLSSFPGKVFGILGKLCKPVDKSYNLAKLRVFQKWNNAFVVNSPETAAACIQYIKEMKYPPQKFIPLDDSLMVRKVDARIQSIIDSKKADLVRNYVELLPGVDSSVGRALDFVCGTILVCTTSDEASTIAYKQQGGYLTTVSKDGTICHKNGKISGGSKALTKEGEQFVQAELEEIAKRRDELIGLLRALPRSDLFQKEYQLKEAKRTLELFIADKPRQLKEHEARLKNVQDAIDDIQNTINAKEVLRDKLHQQCEQLRTEITALTAEKKALEQKTFATFCLEHGINDLEAFENEDVQLRKEHTEKVAKLKEALEKLTNELAYLDNSSQDELARAEKNLQTAQAELVEAQMKNQEYQKENMMKHNDYAESKDIYEGVEKEFNELKEEIAAIKAQNKKIRSIKAQFIKLEKEKQLNIASLGEQLHRLFFECRMNQLIIPLKNGDFRNVELFEGDTPDPSDEATQTIKLKAVECKMDYSHVHGIDQSQMKDNSKREQLIKHKKKEMTEIENQITIKQSGAMSAADYNERVIKAREAEAEVLKIFDKISTELTTARKALNEMKKQRNDLFMATFNKMKRDVDYYYKLLYNNANAQAFMTLVGTGEPYESKIHFATIPPGKKQTNIDDLSGGEKAMAILALLFAGKPQNVHCVLMDEFDEALDRRNMGYVSRFMDVLSSRGIQFIFVSHRVELYAHANKLIGNASHCAKGCTFRSIIYCIDVREYTGGRGGIDYDPESKEEVEKQRDAKKEFKRILKLEGEKSCDENQVNEFTKEFNEMYKGQIVSNFIRGLERQEPFKLCPNNEDIENLKQLILGMNMGDF